MAQTSGESKPSLFGIIISPVQQLQRIKQQPVFWLPWVLFCILIGLLIGVAGYVEMSQPEYTQKLLSSFPASERAGVDVEVLKINSLSFAVFGNMFVVLLLPAIAAAVTLGLVRVLRGKGRYKQFFSFFAHLNILFVCAFLVEVIVLVIAGEPRPAPLLSLASVIPADGALQKLLSTWDAFTIWQAVLLHLAMRELAGFNAVKSWSIAAAYLLMLFAMSFLAL